MKKWFRLDTAALIFPAVMSKRWSNVFRQSMTLDEEVDPELLRKALGELKNRFPTFFVRLRKGFFWCYLEEVDILPQVREDYAYPLTPMLPRELRKNCIRVLYYKNRIAVEFFHSVTDGNGAIIFLKALCARYLELKYGESICGQEGIPDIYADPEDCELEDSFKTNNTGFGEERVGKTSHHLRGKPTRDGFRHLVTGTVQTDKLKELCREYDCTITVFLTALLIKAIIRLQASTVRRKKMKDVKITVPVDLRRIYGSKTLRNFVLTLEVGVDPRQGEYSLKEICDSVKHQLAAKATAKGMAGMVASNAEPQNSIAVRLTPRVIKHFFMYLVYLYVGERGGCLNISNLGQIKLPENMEKHVEKAEFIIGNQLTYPNNCSVVSYKGNTAISLIRNIEESELERLFFSSLVELGIPVYVESNER